MKAMNEWPGAVAGWFNEGGPWGGGRGSGGGSGGDSGGAGPRNPWQQPPGGGGKPRGPSALDELLKRGRKGLPNGKLPWNGMIAGYVVAGVVVLWLLLSCFHQIGPKERGVVTFFGKYSRTLEPGVSLTFPAPIETVKIVDIQFRKIDIPGGTGEKLVLTRDENIIDLDYSVRWSVRSPELYVFQLEDEEAATATIKSVGESAMRAAVANIAFNDAIGNGRTAMESDVALRMQQLLDRYRLGIHIDGVAVNNAGPPEAVNDAFKGVSAAQQDAITSINNANARAQQVIAAAEGEAAAFDRVYAQYKLAPEVTRRRLYYETMEAVLAKVDKTIIEAPGVTPYLPLGNKAPAPAALPNPPQGGAQ